MVNYSGSLRIDYNIGGVRYTTEAGSLPNNTWSHVAVVFDESSDYIKMYINGQLETTVTNVTGTINNNSYNFTIGDWGDHSNERQFIGKIDETMVYSRALTDDEIASLYYNNSTGKYQSYLYYAEDTNKLSISMTEGNLSEIEDQSYFENELSIIGGEAQQSEGLYFDGVDDYISLGNPSSLNVNQELTISAWIKTPSEARHRIVYARGRGGGSWSGYELAVYSGHKLRFTANDGSITTIDLYGTTIVDDNQWHHIAVTFDGETVTLYVDGEYDNSTTGTIPTTDRDCYIGRREGGNYFKGNMRNFLLLSEKLSEEAISSLSNTFSMIKPRTMGTIIPLVITKTKDNTNQLKITIGQNEVYLDNPSSNSVLNNITITDVAGNGLTIISLLVIENECCLLNNDGSISSVEPYIAGLPDYNQEGGIITGELDYSSDKMGLEITNINNTNNKNLLMTLKLMVNCEKDGGKLVISPGDGTNWGNYRWTITDDLKYNQTEKISNNEIVTLQVNTSASGNTTDRLRLFIEGNTGSSSLSLLGISIVKVDNLNSYTIDEFLPTGMTSQINSKGHHIYFDEEGLVLEDDQQDGWDSDLSYIEIPTHGSTITGSAHVSFDWRIDVEDQDDSDATVVAGIVLPAGDNEPLVITLAEGDNKGSITEGEIMTPYVNDWNDDGLVDFYNEWRHTDINLADQLSSLASNWQGNIRIFIDGDGAGKKFRLKVANFSIYECHTSLLSLVGKRVGEKKTTDFYITDWLASPMYPRYDLSERLPKNNLVINGDFENGYDENSLLPNGWSPVQFSSQAHIKKMGRTWLNYAPNPNGSYCLVLERDPGFSVFDSSTWDGARIKQAIDIGTVKEDEFLVSFWYYAPSATPVVRVAGNSETLPSVSDWTYWQKAYAIDKTSGFDVIDLQQYSSAGGYCIFDDIRVEPSGWSGVDNNTSEVAKLRTIDPENMTEYTLTDGWYEITNISSNYLQAVDETTGGLGGSYSTTSGYSQYYLSEFFVRMTDGEKDDQWQLTVTEDKTSQNVYAVWINGELVKITNGGTFIISNVQLYRGINRLLIEQIVEGKDDWNTNRFKVKLQRANWSGYEVRTLREVPDLTRTPVIYYDNQYKTKWITRDGSESELLLDLPFGEEEGTMVVDHSYNNEEINITGANWTGDGLYFDGNNDRVSIHLDDITTFDQDDTFTISAWFKTDGIVTGDERRTIFTIRNQSITGSSTMINAWLKADNVLFWRIRDQMATSGYVNEDFAVNTADADLDDGNWHNVVIVRGTSSSTLYIDGKAVRTKTNPAGTYTFEFKHIDIGMDQYPHETYRYPFKGNIREMKIWKRFLTEEEVKLVMMGQKEEYGVIDTPELIASGIARGLAINGLIGKVVSTRRLRYYLKAENNMYSNYWAYNHDNYGTETWDTEPLPPLPTLASPSLADDQGNETSGKSHAIEYLEEHPETNQVDWYYSEYLNDGIQVRYHKYRTTRTFDITKGGKTIWHPFGAILMTSDAVPEDVFSADNGYNNTKMEKFLEMGGKLIFSGGYVPFAYTAPGIGYAVFATTMGAGGYDYEGALGHQNLLDIDEMNNDGGTFSSGMFLTGIVDDSYNDMLVNEETNNAPGSGWTLGNLDDFNYEPIMVTDSSWTHLPHIGYSTHMVLVKHEYDIELVRELDTSNIRHIGIFNADGTSSSPDCRYSHEDPSDLNQDSIDSSYKKERMIDPLGAGLWFRPLLGDVQGAYDYKPPSNTEGFPVGRYGYRIQYTANHCWDTYDYSHFERVNVGTGLVQAGTNGKGIVGILPMFNWSVQLFGLNNRGVEKGKWSDRGKGSITNSPTTKEYARLYIANVTGKCVVNAFLEAQLVNACRDNTTVGTNFLNIGHDNELGAESEQIDQDKAYNNGYLTDESEYGPITFSSYSKLDDSNPGVSSSYSWDDYLFGQSSYSVYGSSFAKAVGNSHFNSIWKDSLFNKINDANYDLQDIVPAWDYLFTTAYIDNSYASIKGETPYNDSLRTAKIKTMTVNNLKVDTKVDGTLMYVFVQSENDGKRYEYRQWVEVPDYNNQPIRGYNFGIDNQGSLPSYYHSSGHDNLATDLGWSLYDQRLSDYTSHIFSYWNTYSSDDNEIVLRNPNNGYWGSGQENSSREPLIIAYLNERIVVDPNDSPALAICGYSFNEEGLLRANTVNSKIMTFSDNDLPINALVINPYNNYNGMEVGEFNHPRTIRVRLYDSNNKLVYSKSEEMIPPAYTSDYYPETKLDASSTDERGFYYVSPLVIDIDEESIEANSIEIEIWSCWKPSPDHDYPIKVRVGEIEIYTGIEPSTKLYNYNESEIINRVPLLDDSDATKTGLVVDLGCDDDTIDNNKYSSRPLQNSYLTVIIGVSSDANNTGGNKSRRFNFGYTAPISVTTGLPNYKQSNKDQPDLLEYIFAIIETVGPFMILIIAINIIIDTLVGPEGWWHAIWMVIQVIQFVELALILVGGFNFRDSPLYGEILAVRLMYDWIIDIDGSIARAALTPNEFDKSTLSWES